MKIIAHNEVKDKNNPEEFVLHYPSLFIATMVQHAIRQLLQKTNETEFDAEYLYEKMNFYAIRPCKFTIQEFTELLEQLRNASLLQKRYNKYRLYNGMLTNAKPVVRPA